MEELAVFRSRELDDGLTREHAQGYVTDEPTAIRLQGSNGACHFLRDKRCTVHDIRPAFCRQFPVQLHALHRIQLNVNLGCRGITDGGDNLAEFGKSIVASIPNKTQEEELARVGERVAWFEEASKEKEVYQEPGRLRAAARGIIPNLADVGGIGKLLAFTNTMPEIGEMPPENILEMVLASEPPDDLELIASQGNYEMLELDNTASLPVYVDEKLRWNTFRAGGGKIHWMMLHEDGKMEPMGAFEMDEVSFMPPNDDARQVFADYAELLNSRDQFLGYSYHVCADMDFEYDLMTVYLGLLATTMLDLWWRASLVGKILGIDKLDGKLALEGIRAYDMDCLDMPTMGEFF